MITADSIMSIDKNEIYEASKEPNVDDIKQLFEWLSLKEDNLRYQAFLLLQARSSYSDDVYPYWELLVSKLKSKNSYQRSIGAMLLAENVRWDLNNKMEDLLEAYLELLNDEKPITVRQSIQSLGKIAEVKPHLGKKIADALITLPLDSIRDTMRKSILLDILGVLFIIRKSSKSEKIEGYILNALSGEILDTKSKKQFKAQL